jgi:hypothetical protein
LFDASSLQRAGWRRGLAFVGAPTPDFRWVPDIPDSENLARAKTE